MGNKISRSIILAERQIWSWRWPSPEVDWRGAVLSVQTHHHFIFSSTGSGNRGRPHQQAQSFWWSWLTGFSIRTHCSLLYEFTISCCWNLCYWVNSPSPTGILSWKWEAAKWWTFSVFLKASICSSRWLDRLVKGLYLPFFSACLKANRYCDSHWRA
jgi:hypothetical protein